MASVSRSRLSLTNVRADRVHANESSEAYMIAVQSLVPMMMIMIVRRSWLHYSVMRLRRCWKDGGSAALA